VGRLVARPPDSQVAWAWLAVLATPVGVGAAMVVARAVESQYAEARLVGSVVAAIVAVIAPTAAIVMGFLGLDRLWGRVALATGVVLLIAIGIAIYRFADSVAAIAFAAYAYAVAMVAVMALAASAARRRASSRLRSPLA